MENIKLLIVSCLVVLMQGCGPHRVQESDATELEAETSTGERLCFSSYDTRKDEVRDTSFALPRRILDDPAAFMRILTGVQMINRTWTDTYNYPRKLLFRDSILRDISSILANSGEVPIYLVEEILFAEIADYTLSMRRKGENSYTVCDNESTYKYDIVNGCVPYKHENIWSISKTFRELVDSWDKEKLLTLGTTYYEEGESWDCCVTRLTLGIDSVHVDMVKLSLLNFTIMDNVDDWDNQH